MTNGFLIFDKPTGITSNQGVGYVKKATGVRKIGHAGTLDPLATGALVMGIGNVTRLIRYIQDQPKEYVATAVFGVETDTLDSDGEVLSSVEMNFTSDQLMELIPTFSGKIMQVPPMVSALKHEGQRLHDLARAGEVVEREPREVEVHDLEVLEVGDGPQPSVRFKAVVGKGTYIRSLADDMARALGGHAHLSALRRTRIGKLRVSAGVTLDDLANWEDYFLTPNEALAHLDEVVLSADDAALVRNGARFDSGAMTEPDPDAPFRVLDPDGDLLAVYRVVDGEARSDVVLPS